MNKKYILVLIVVLVLSSMACQASSRFLGGNAASPTSLPAAPTLSSSSLSIPEALPASDQTLVILYEQVMPGIVSIQVQTEEGQGVGSGIVFDTQGHVVTNEHVVSGAKSIEVDFYSGYKAYAKVIGVDLDSDLAVLKVEAPESEFHPLVLADSNQVRVGQAVVAIGAPFGLSGTMTTGIISSLGRTLPSGRASPGGGRFSAADLIQTDAAINPGNSGGPLLNLKGEVVGINRAIRTESSNASGEPLNSGIGFAIASNIIRRVAPGIITNGKYDYPYIGMSSVDNLPLEQIAQLGLKSHQGIYVVEVIAGGPAEKAGLRGSNNQSAASAGGDLIIAIDGLPVKNFNELMRYLVSNKSPGDQVVLTVLRGDEKVDLTITLGKRP